MRILKLQIVLLLLTVYCCYLSHFLQYQNVFAPLIKLEADYDKVCFMTFRIMCSFINSFYNHVLDIPFIILDIVESYCLNFVIDDERISKQGQCHDSMGYWAKQEAYCIFCFSKSTWLSHFCVLWFFKVLLLLHGSIFSYFFLWWKLNCSYCCYRKTMSCVSYLEMSCGCVIQGMQPIHRGSQLGMWYVHSQDFEF